MVLETREDLVKIVRSDNNIRNLEAYVERNPNDAEARYQLGCAYEKYGVYSACVLINKAVENWKRAKSINPRSVETRSPLVYGDVNERVKELEKRLGQTSESEEFVVATLSLLGNAYCQKGFETRFVYSKKALDELTKTIEFNPEHKDANSSRSTIISGLSNELNMIKHNFRALRNLEACDLTQAEFHYNLGDSYFTKEDYTKAMEEYKKAIFGYHKFQIDRGVEKIEGILSWPTAFLKALLTFPIKIIRGY